MYPVISGHNSIFWGRWGGVGELKRSLLRLTSSSPCVFTCHPLLFCGVCSVIFLLLLLNVLGSRRRCGAKGHRRTGGPLGHLSSSRRTRLGEPKVQRAFKCQVSLVCGSHAGDNSTLSSLGVSPPHPPVCRTSQDNSLLNT